MKNKIIYIILLIVVILLFIIINLLNVDTFKSKNKITTKVTTTKSLSGDKIFEDSFYIEGMEEKIKVKEYKSPIGFCLDYMIDYFKINILSNNTILLSSLYDDKIYLKIEKIEELEYSKEAKEKDEDIIDGYYYKYYFLKGNDLYLKVTKCVLNTSEYLSGYSIRMDYIINSIKY